MYIIIVGAGDIGGPLIDIATSAGNEVVVVEQDRDRADEVADDHDCLVLNADATSRDVLADAGAERADAVISTTDRDPTNIMVSLLSKEFAVPAILSVVHDPDHMDVFRQIGVNTMENPLEAIADFMRVGETAEVFEISVADDAPIAGMSLSAAAEEGLLGPETLVVAVERPGGDGPVTPGGETVLEAGDDVTVYSGEGATGELTDVFGHGEDG